MLTSGKWPLLVLPLQCLVSVEDQNALPAQQASARELYRKSVGPTSPSTVGRYRSHSPDRMPRESIPRCEAITQLGQSSAQFLAFAALLKSIPTLPDEAGDMRGRCRCPFQPCSAVRRGHCGVSWTVYLHRPESAADLARTLDRQLTFCVPAAYSRDFYKARTPPTSATVFV